MNAVAQAIRELELRLMDPNVRRSSALAEPLLADDFVEFGTSGRIYTKASVLDAMAADASPAPEVMDFGVKNLGPSVVLATYRTIRRGTGGEVLGQSLRCSLWWQVAGTWQIVFHQSTPVAP